MNHTPGPWHISEAECPPDGLDCPLQDVVKDDWPVLVPTPVGRPGLVITPDEARANAHLIAAAPELLVACEEIYKLIAGNRPLYDVVAQLRAAIAKAKGIKP